MSQLVAVKNATSSTSSMSSHLSYYVYKVWTVEGDIRVSHLPFMESGPWSVLAIISAYLYFVKVYGPAMMKSRPALSLKEVMVAYNFFMVLLSFWMFYEGCMFLNFGLDTWGCGKNDYVSESVSSKRFIFVGWCFFFSKIIEFSDTIFMVLRKRLDQVTNLHIIHHSIVPFSVWMGFRFGAMHGSNAWFPLLNSLVHTIMYAYFGLMALSDSLSPQTVKFLRVHKPWVTRFQILQFCLALVHVFVALIASVTTCPSGHIPKTFFVLNLSNALLFLGLFFHFYQKSYRSIRKDQNLSQDEKETKSM